MHFVSSIPCLFFIWPPCIIICYQSMLHDSFVLILLACLPWYESKLYFWLYCQNPPCLHWKHSRSCKPHTFGLDSWMNDEFFPIIMSQQKAESMVYRGIVKYTLLPKIPFEWQGNCISFLPIFLLDHKSSGSRTELAFMSGKDTT